MAEWKKLPFSVNLKSTPVIECLASSSNCSSFQIFFSKQYIFEGKMSLNNEHNEKISSHFKGYKIINLSLVHYLEEYIHSFINFVILINFQIILIWFSTRMNCSPHTHPPPIRIIEQIIKTSTWKNSGKQLRRAVELYNSMRHHPNFQFEEDGRCAQNTVRWSPFYWA